MVGVACLAKERGYDINGCDLSISSDYSEQLANLKIDVSCGQSEEHLNGIDELVISPAVLFKDRYKTIGEIVKAEEQGIPVVRWQQFIDEHLANDRDLIGVCGTHGKTTTTTLVANMLESCGADPSAVIGGINRRWGRNYKNGSGKYFVCEADEYGHNFTYYHPKYIIINNVEMEHPEFFRNLEDYKDNFCKFISNIGENGAIVFNGDDPNIIDVLQRMDDLLRSKNIKLISYHLERNERDGDKERNLEKSTNGANGEFGKKNRREENIGGNSKYNSKYNWDSIAPNGTIASIEGLKLNRESLVSESLEEQSYPLSIGKGYFLLNNEKFRPVDGLEGEHNMRNMSAALLLLLHLGYGADELREALSTCIGAKRRMEKVFESDSFVVYDDYAHHHTQVYNNLRTLRNRFTPGEKLVAILEPHLISRFTGNSGRYIEAMEIADFPIITKFFKSREMDLAVPEMDGYLKNTKIEYIPDFDEVINYVSGIISSIAFRRLHIVIMGAGLSYKLTKELVSYLLKTVDNADLLYEKVG